MELEQFDQCAASMPGVIRVVRDLPVSRERVSTALKA